MRALILVLALLFAPASAEPTGMVDEHMGQPLAEAPLLEPPPKAEVDARTDALSTRLRCPVCQGLSVSASPSEAARAMRERIRELVAQGYADEQIVDYFVGRYGTWVLLEPPREGFAWLLWLAPALAVGAGLGGLAWRFAGGRKEDAPPAPPPANRHEDPYRAAVLAELGDRPGGEP